MKKFLRLEMPAAAKEIPAELDVRILAHAAIRARSSRRKRLALKMLIPASAAGAAAAVTLMCLPDAAISPALPAKSPALAAVSVPAQPSGKISAAIPQQPSAAAPTPVPRVAQSAEMLALADTSSLEQECYNLTVMTDYSFDAEGMFI
jgi:hypothetical protein